MDAYALWLKLCDWVLGFVTEGTMTDDYPWFDWRAAFDWGDPPARAVEAAVVKPCSRGVQVSADGVKYLL